MFRPSGETNNPPYLNSLHSKSMMEKGDNDKDEEWVFVDDEDVDKEESELKGNKGNSECSSDNSSKVRGKGHTDFDFDLAKDINIIQSQPQLGKEAHKKRKRRSSIFSKFSSLRNSLPFSSSFSSSKKRKLRASLEEEQEQSHVKCKNSSLQTTSSSLSSPQIRGGGEGGRRTLILEEVEKEYIKYIHRQYLSASLHALFLDPSKMARNKLYIPLDCDKDKDKVEINQKTINLDVQCNLHYYQGFHDLASVILVLFTHNECYQTDNISSQEEDLLSSHFSYQNQNDEEERHEEKEKASSVNNDKLTAHTSSFPFNLGLNKVKGPQKHKRSQVLPLLSPVPVSVSFNTDDNKARGSSSNRKIKNHYHENQSPQQQEQQHQQQHGIALDNSDIKSYKIDESSNLSSSILDYRGYYDGQLAFRVLSTLAHEHAFLRTCMKENFDSLKSLLASLYPLLEKVDSKLAIFLKECHLLGKITRRKRKGTININENVEVEEIEEEIFPVFALSWVLTWFAHDVHSFKLAARIYDCIISMHYFSQKKQTSCLFILYICAALLIFHREELLSLPNDFATIHTYLSALPTHETIFQKVSSTDHIKDSEKKNTSLIFFGFKKSNMGKQPKAHSNLPDLYDNFSQKERFKKQKISKETKWDLILQQARELYQQCSQEEVLLGLCESTSLSTKEKSFLTEFTTLKTKDQSTKDIEMENYCLNTTRQCQRHDCIDSSCKSRCHRYRIEAVDCGLLDESVLVNLEA